jgi:hypothetical protein
MSARYRIVVQGEGPERPYVLRCLKYKYLVLGWNVNGKCEFRSLHDAQDWLRTCYLSLYDRWELLISDTEPLTAANFIAARNLIIFIERVK